MSKKFAFLLRASTALVAPLVAFGAYARPTAQTVEPISKVSTPYEASAPSLKLIADKEKKQTCNKDGTSVTGGTKWCRSGEWHECNGKNGEWVNTRQKCKK